MPFTPFIYFWRKKYEKIIAIVLALLMLLAFVACDNEKTDDPSESGSTENTTTDSGSQNENTAEALLAKFGLTPEKVTTSVCDHTEEEYILNGSSVMIYSVYICVNDFILSIPE